MSDLYGAAALMFWLGKHRPADLKRARSCAGSTAFRVLMCELTGISADWRFDSHDHACEAFLDVLQRPSKLSSLSAPNAAEVEEIEAFRCQPAHVSHVEPEREPLEHFGKRTPFDHFPDMHGWIVSVGGPEEGRPWDEPQHNLQRLNDGSAVCGSAHLLRA